MGAEFYETWSALRDDLKARGELSELEPLLESLATSANDDRKRALLASARLEFGAHFDRQDISSVARNDLRWLNPELLAEVLSSLADPTIVGFPEERLEIVRPLFEMSERPLVLAAMRFVTAPDRSTESDLLGQPSLGQDGSWGLNRSAETELKLQLGWASLRGYLCSDSGLGVLNHPAFRLRPPSDPGWWEQQLQKATALCATGSTEAGCSMLQQLLLREPPAWSRPRLAYTVARYAPLATEHWRDWVNTCRDSLPRPADAHSSFDKAVFTLLQLLAGEIKPKLARVAEVSDQLQSEPWALFAAFCAIEHVGCAEELGLRISGLDRTELAALPWTGREASFSARCCQLDDHTLALTLLLHAYQNRLDDGIRSAIASVAETMSTRDVRKVTREFPLGDRQLGDVLPPRLQASLRRGWTHRAVVDGSNVMWGGHDREAGARPRLAYLQDVLTTLAAAGFDQVEAYVDARTQYDVSDGDALELKRMHARGQVSVVPGHADPVIARAFLSDPERSELITCDIYRDLPTKYPDLTALPDFYPSHWRKFFIGPDGRVAWSCPLDMKVTL